MTQEKLDVLPSDSSQQPEDSSTLLTNSEDSPAAQPKVSQWFSRQRLLLVGIVAIFVALTWPTWRWLWEEWMANEYYSHGVLIFPAALFLAWRRLTLDPTAKPTWFKQDFRGVVLMGVSLLLYLYFVEMKAYYLATIAIILLIASLVWVCLGWRTLRGLAFPIGYLLLMVPLPLIERSTYPLAMFTGVCSGALVRFFGLPIQIVGNAVEMPGTDLLIGAQCSGINSMITLIALTALCAYLFQGPWWGRIGLVLLSIPLSMAGNILRVGNLLYIAYYWGVDAAFTFYHDYSGIFFFVIVFLLIMPLMRLLRDRKSVV